MAVTGGERRSRVLARWRLAAAAAAGAVAMTAATAGWAATSSQPASPGYGNSSGNSLAIVPVAAGLPFNITFGGTITTHQNQVSQAHAQWMNLGLVGTALAAEGCDGGAPPFPAEDQPQPVRVDSRDPGASDGTTAVNGEGAFRDFARATATPFAEAESSVAPAGVPGVVLVEGARTRSTTGVDADGNPRATAIADVARLSFGGGLVELLAMHWEALSQFGGDPAGSFRIGGLSIAGMPFPVDDPTAAIELANDVLASLGFRIGAPRSHVDEGVLFVDPLEIVVVPNATRDALTNVVLNGVQPIREELFGFLLEEYCDSAGYITVADIFVGALTGGGAFGLELGGVRTTLRDTGALASFGSGTKLPPVQLPPGPSSTLPELAAAPATPAAPARPEVRTVAPVDDVADQRDRARWVALAALLVGAGLVEADRRTMRATAAPVDGGEERIDG